MTAPAHLASRSIIALTGPETRDFLQGLVTNDVRKLTPEAPLYTALLTPQGKVLFDFLLFAEGDTVLLDCASAVAETLQKRLSLYRLRARVDIARRDDLAVLATWDDGAGSSESRSDPRLPELGQRQIVFKEAVSSQAQAEDAYTAFRLALGVPEAGDFGQDKMFALDAGLAELHGVAFDKGCYVGQELTARMKHRGTARKRLLPIASLAGQRLPAPESAVTAGGRELGSLMSTYGERGFALIRLDRLDETGGAAAEAGGVPLNISKPQWLFA